MTATVKDVQTALQQAAHPDAKIQFKIGEDVFDVDALEVDQSTSMKRGDLAPVLIEAALVLVPTTAEVPTAKQRLIEDRDALAKQSDSYTAYIQSETFQHELQVVQGLIQTEADAMRTRLVALNRRIKLLDDFETVPPITEALSDEQFAAVEKQKDAALAPWQARLIKERDDLGQLLAKLRGAIGSPKFRELSQPAREKLVLQEGIMSSYYEILTQRVGAIG